MTPYNRNILGIRVDFGYTYDSVLQEIEQKMIPDGKCHYICTTNPEFIVDAQKDLEFKDIINKSDLSLPDGAGILFAEKYMEKVSNIKHGAFYKYHLFVEGIKMLFDINKLGQTITGVQLTENILDFCNKKGMSIFILGGRYRNRRGEKLYDTRDMAVDVADLIKVKYPNVNIIGATSKFSGKKSDDGPSIEYIKKCMSEHDARYIDFMFVAYNHVFQEKWIVRNATNIPVKVAIGIGGTLDYMLGVQKKDPEIIKYYHIGWLYRLITQPWRIKRIYKAFPTFPLLVYKNVLRANSNYTK